MLIKLDVLQLDTVTGGDFPGEVIAAAQATRQRVHNSIDPAGPPTSNVFANAGRVISSIVPQFDPAMMQVAGCYGAWKNALGQAKDGILSRLSAPHRP
jgi:hypothetical protein